MLVQKFKQLQKKEKKKNNHIHPVFIPPRCTSSLLCIYKPKLSKWMKITDSRLGTTVADRADHVHAWRTLLSSDGTHVLAAMLLCECPWVFFCFFFHQCAMSQLFAAAHWSSGPKGSHLGSVTLEPHCTLSIDDVSA